MIQKFERVWDALPIEVNPQFDTGFAAAGIYVNRVGPAQIPKETEVGEVFPPQFAGQLGGARPQTKSFASETAAITGESKRSINQHLARAEALGDDIDRLVGTSLDKGVEADALIKLPEPERKELIERAGVTERKKVLPGAFTLHGA